MKVTISKLIEMFKHEKKIYQDLRKENLALAKENGFLIKLCDLGKKAILSMGSKCDVLLTNI